MSTRDYYADIDPFACAWMRELIAGGQIPEGTVDERDIRTTQATELVGYRRVHLFGGIGGWAHALELAGWGERSVWTVSCPCQPFSTAGKQQGEEDPRHLWPHVAALVRQCRPDTILGEQVSGAGGYRWLDGVRASVEAAGYALGAVDLPAACAGAPHIRNRLFWVAVRLAEPEGAGRRVQPGSHGGETGTSAGEVRGGQVRGQQRPALDEQPEPCGSARGMENAEQQRRQGRRASVRGRSVDCGGGESPGSSGDSRRLDDTPGERAGHPGSPQPQGDGADDGVPGAAGAGDSGLGDSDLQQGSERNIRSQGGQSAPFGPNTGRSGPRNGNSFWDDFDLVRCRDEKVRRIEPGTFPLANGLPPGLVDVWAACRPDEPLPQAFTGRVGILRGFGNAIVPEVAALFIRAFLDAEQDFQGGK